MANYNSSYTGAQIDSAVGRANSTDVTAGTVAASKAVVVDSNKDVTGFRNITGTGTATFANFVGTGDIDIGDASGDTVTITASVDSNIVPSADDTYDLGGSSAQWKDLYVDGTAYIDAIDFNGTAITSTGAELNLIDGGTARGTTAVATGDGILINDAGTMRMTNVDTVSTYFASHNVGGGNIVTTGALDSGSITSGFGNIDIGSSTFDTTGAVATGALTVGGNIDFNSGTIDLSTQTVDVTLNAAVDALNFDSNTLSIDASNNRVGIGTASPSVPLDVVGTLKVGAASGGRYFNLINDSANSYLDVSHGLVVRTNGASSLVSSMFISTAGNVGIGTAAPLAKFEIQKAGVDTNAETDAFLNLHDSSVYNWGLRLDTGSTLHFDTEYSSTDVTRVTFQRDGNVGIGTAAPGEKLEVAGTIWINPSGQADLYVDGHTSSDATVRLMEGGSSEFTIMHDSNVSRFQIRDGNPSGTEVFSIEDGASANSLYINSSGNVGIGSADPQSLLALQSGALSITSVSTATACGFYMDAQHVALGADSTQDLWTVTFQDNYGSAIVELQFAGQGHADSDPYIIGTYRLINSNTSVAVTDISEAVAACTTDQTTSTSSCTFRITETSTQNVRGTAWIRVVGGGNDANTEASSGLTLTQD